MKNLKKKILPAIIAVAIVFTAVPMTVFANAAALEQAVNNAIMDAFNRNNVTGVLVSEAFTVSLSNDDNNILNTGGSVEITRLVPQALRGDYTYALFSVTPISPTEFNVVQIGQKGSTVKADSSHNVKFTLTGTVAPAYILVALPAGFGVVPPTGLADMTPYTVAMIVFIVISAGLWGYVIKRKFGRKNA